MSSASLIMAIISSNCATSPYFTNDNVLEEKASEFEFLSLQQHPATPTRHHADSLDQKIELSSGKLSDDRI